MVETRKAITSMVSNEVVEVVTDIEGTAITTIPLVCETFDCDYVVIKQEDKWLVRIAKK